VARIVFRQSRPPDRQDAAEQSEPSWRETVAAGGASSLAVAATAAWRAGVEGQPAWQPINAVSHIAWGPCAAEEQRLSARYTGLGLLLNGAACVFWAWLYRRWRRSERGPVSPLRLAGRGVTISALAYVTDYYLVPRRLTPGFELSLSRRSFHWLYSALAAGLILPEWLAFRRRRRSG